MVHIGWSVDKSTQLAGCHEFFRCGWAAKGWWAQLNPDSESGASSRESYQAVGWEDSWPGLHRRGISSPVSSLALARPQKSKDRRTERCCHLVRTEWHGVARSGWSKQLLPAWLWPNVARGAVSRHACEGQVFMFSSMDGIVGMKRACWTPGVVEHEPDTGWSNKIMTCPDK